MKLVWRKVYGFGLAFELVNFSDDRLRWIQRVAFCKLFLGPLLILFHVPLERKHAYLP